MTTTNELKEAGFKFNPDARRWEDSLGVVTFEEGDFESNNGAPDYFVVWVEESRFFFHNEAKAIAFAIVASEHIE